MNYIRHLNAFFSSIRSDNRLTSSHVSLYLALFQYWNFNRFQNPFPVYRVNMMQLSKIGSKNTYHKCIKELHLAQYIHYHPPASKFQPVRISMIRLDIKEEVTNYKQLDLFSINNGTDSVPNLTDTSTDFDTGTVPNVGQYIKPNNKQLNSVPGTPTEIFKRNKKLSEKINELAGVPKLVPTLEEVEEFFKSSNYPEEEAKKFFHYNNGRNWMLSDKFPIKNWNAIAHKWMLNPKKQTAQQPDPAKDIQYLYETFLEGKKVFHHLQPEHYDLLQLKLTDETMQQARQERISQVTGTNQHSINLIWEAYLTNDSNNSLAIKDKPNLIAIAKRMEVLKHFQQQKQLGTITLIIKSK